MKKDAKMIAQFMTLDELKALKIIPSFTPVFQAFLFSGEFALQMQKKYHREEK